MADNQPTQPTIIETGSNSSINTVLIVIVLVLLVAFGVWWYKTYHVASPTQPASTSGGSVQINVGGSQPSTNASASQTQ